MYEQRMLWHKTGGCPSTPKELQEVDAPYPLNAHANAVLGIGPQFIKPLEDDIPTDPDEVRAGLDTEEEDIKEEPPTTVGGEPILPGLED